MCCVVSSHSWITNRDSGVFLISKLYKCSYWYSKVHFCWCTWRPEHPASVCNGDLCQVDVRDGGIKVSCTVTCTQFKCLIYVLKIYNFINTMPGSCYPYVQLDTLTVRTIQMLCKAPWRASCASCCLRHMTFTLALSRYGTTRMFTYWYYLHCKSSMVILTNKNGYLSCTFVFATLSSEQRYKECLRISPKKYYMRDWVVE